MALTYAHGAAYGWRARIGLLQPTVISDTNPFEFYLMAPAGVQMVLTSLGLVETNPEQYAIALANLETPVKRVLSRHVDAIIQSGVPPIVIKGWGAEAELKQRVAKLTDVPYITDVAACIAALQALGVDRVALACGFDADTVELIRQYVAHAGIEVVGAERIRRTEGDAPTLESVYRAGQRARRAFPSAQGIWLTPASVPTVGAIADLETDTGLSVISSAQTLMWAGLQLAGVREHVEGFGRLFEQPYPASERS